MKLFNKFNVLYLISFIAFGVGCGGAPGSETGDNVSLEMTVTAPSSSSPSSLVIPALTFDQAEAAALLASDFSESIAIGAECRVETLEGVPIGNSGTTDSDGVCTCSGLTEAQLSQGVVVIADVGNVEMKTFLLPDAEDFESDTITASMDSESNMAFAILTRETDGDLTDSTFDKKCLMEAARAMVGEEAASNEVEDTGDAAEFLHSINQSLIVEGNVINPSACLSQILSGNFSCVPDDVDIDVAEEAAEVALPLFGLVRESYCEQDDDGNIPWQEARTAAGNSFEPKAIAGVLTKLQPEETSAYDVSVFRGFAHGVASMGSAGFQLFADPHAWEASSRQFRLASEVFTDPARASVGVGFLAATFPPPSTSGDYTSIDWNTFSPVTGALAALNGYQDYVSKSGSNYAAPKTIYDSLNTVFGNDARRQAIAVGGTASGLGSLLTDFASTGGTNFSSSSYTSQFRLPPGAACTADSQCLPGDSCPGGILRCTSFSRTIGLPCLSRDNCSSTEVCVGGLYGAQCVLTAGLVTGAPVVGGYTPPSSGTAGGACPCGGGLTCINGICRSSSEKFPPFAPCSTDNQCDSNSCTGGICSLTAEYASGTAGGASRKGVGAPCVSPPECQSSFCQNGICQDPPNVYAGSVNTTFDTYVAPPDFTPPDTQTTTTSTTTTGSTTGGSTGSTTGDSSSSSSTTTTTSTGGTSGDSTSSTSTTGSSSTDSTTTTGGSTGSTTGSTTGDSSTTTTGSTTGGDPEPPAYPDSLSDTFDGSSLDSSWTIFNNDRMTYSVSGGALHMIPTTNIPWYNGRTGPLIYKLVEGNFKVTATVRARRRSPNNHLAVTPAYQLAGIMARNPSSPVQDSQNYVHAAVGHPNNGSTAQGVEWKNTINGTGSITGSAWSSVACSASVPCTTGDADLRICKVGSLFIQYRRAAGSSNAWQETYRMTRTDLGALNELQVGMIAYSNVTPDMQASFEGIAFDEVSAEADCTTN